MGLSAEGNTETVGEKRENEMMKNFISDSGDCLFKDSDRRPGCKQ
jgi:hypothetical protein